FLGSAEELGMSTKMVSSIFDNIADKFEIALNAAAEELNQKGYNEVLNIKNNILKTFKRQ
ncbi:MAG: hypothetical protein K6F30_07210, partial [Lachnospiraceae bacterium]|nr:hypothetical protein [Lachnospiraceae bacterium]